jgi:serine/threonine protein kinase, bacterial
MPLPVGAEFGRFEVLSLVDEGGMGEVCIARDSKPQRGVARKVLPASSLRDPGRMARWQQEAEVSASLVHPDSVSTPAEKSP